jgi:hypothetical protein
MIKNFIVDSDILLFCLTGILDYVGRRQSAFGGGGGISGTFYMPQIFSERNVLNRLCKKSIEYFGCKK